MVIRKFLSRCGDFRRYVRSLRHRTRTTSYALEANEMAGRNLSHALRNRDRREGGKQVVSCLEASFPLDAGETTSERLRDVVARIHDTAPRDGR